MNDIELRDLDGVAWETLATAFNAAFAGYSVPMEMTAVSLASMQRRRGYWAKWSVGAFEGGELVGFALTGRAFDQIYNSGTGVIPRLRGTGLAKRLLEHVIAHAGKEAREYVLEVIDSNAPAIALYKKLGFLETRGLQCWRYEPTSAPFEPLPILANLVKIKPDLIPSWQNTRLAIDREVHQPVILGNQDGCVEVYGTNGELLHLAVRPEARRRGLGARLLATAAAYAEKPLRIINLDENITSVSDFLTAAGATRTVRQLEMMLPLHS